MRTRPNDFFAWRTLYQQAASSVGHDAAYYFTHGREPKVLRDIMAGINRMERIHRRLQAELDAGTKSAIMALMELIREYDE
jgi:hypothetical protein